MYNEKISYKLIGILFLTFMVGFLYCFIILPNIQNNFNIELDGEQYNIIAQNIYQGKGFFFDKGQEPIISDARYTLGRPPLYPYFLVLIYLIFGQKIWIVQLIQIVISTVTGYVIYKIANKIFEERVALFSAIVYGIHPLFFWYPPRLYTETILIFLLAIIVYYTILLFENLSLKHSIMLGMLLGIFNLVKSSMLLFPLYIVVGLLCFYTYQKRQVIKSFLVINILMALIISPWTLRNYIVSDHFVPVQIGIGLQFFRGNSIVFNNKAGLLKSSFNEPLATSLQEEQIILNQLRINTKQGKEYDIFNVFDEMMLEWLVNNPKKFLKKIVKGSLFFWYLGSTEFKTKLILITQLLILIPSIVGMYFSLKDNKKVLPLMLVILYFLLIHAPLVAVGRYAVPIMPYMIIFAAYGCLNSFKKLIKS